MTPGAFALAPEAARLFLPAALPICLWVALSDLRAMKIRNLAVLALLVAFVILAPFVLPPQVMALRLAQGAGVLVLGVVLTALRAMGAGDAKFLAAAAPYVAPGDAARVLTLLAGLTLAAVATHRAARATPLRRLAPNWASWNAARFPMGLALGPALAAYLALAAI